MFLQLRPTVDVNGIASYPAGLIGGQEGDDGADIVSSAKRFSDCMPSV
jgi:hypothetical protein